MVTKNNIVNRKDGNLAHSKSATDDNVDENETHQLHHPHHLNQPYGGNGFTPFSSSSHPLLAPPPKKAKLNRQNQQQQQQQQQQRCNNSNDSTLFSPGPTRILKGSSSSSSRKSLTTTTTTATRSSTTKRRTPPGAASSSSSSSRKTSKRSALSSPATAVAVNPSQQNPYSTSRGLRHFSMKVCEKVEEKGTTTYNEVADELVRELKQAEEAINLAALARGEVIIPVVKKATRNKKTKLLPNGKTKKNHDDKNIRRRVYDALNVLMAMDIITKDKKEITWRGLPGSRARVDNEDDADATTAATDNAGDGSLYSKTTVNGSNNNENTTPSNSNSNSIIHRHHHHHHRKVDGLSRRQRVQQLQEELVQRRDDIRAKRECLQELMVQNVCFQNLLGRNHAREIEHQRNRQHQHQQHQQQQHPRYEKSTTNDGEREGNSNLDNHDGVEEITDEKIPLPFIIVNTDSKSIVQCEMSTPARTDVSFDFSRPFEINDDNEILKRLGMNVTSKDALQRSLPPDLFAYANGKGLLRDIARA